MKTSYLRQIILRWPRWVALLSALYILLSGQSHAQSFFEGYFIGFLIVICVPVGSLAVWLIHALTGGAWGDVLRKYYVRFSQTLGIAFLIGIPNVFWLGRIYEWAHSPDLLSPEKAAYLNAPFFILRLIAYFLVWKMTARLLSRNQSSIAGLLMVVYVLTGTFFAVDWLMSLDYRWYSTIFGILCLTGQVLLAFCLMIILHVLLDQPAASSDEDEKRLRDLGNLVLTMVMFWAYLAFSQYLIIWMGNLPEEIRWYLPRVRDGWGAVASLLIAIHFFIPFLLLLRRVWKQRPSFLAAMAGLIVVMRVIDILWTVFPAWGRALTDITPLHAISMLLPITMYLFLSASFSRSGS